MEITVKCDPKEITALVVGLQERRKNVGDKFAAVVREYLDQAKSAMDRETVMKTLSDDLNRILSSSHIPE